VYLKHLVKGELTGGRLSCHLIQIKAGHAIGDHLHPDKWELHEIIEGSGTGVVNGEEIAYTPGVMSVIPEGISHKVIAGQREMYLLAKFVPALL